MTGTRPRDEVLELLLIDGDNVLHEVRGRRDEGGMAWLLPRLAAWRPPGLHIVVALDGHAAPGLAPRQRGGTGVEIRHAGGRSADDLIVELLGARTYAERTRTAVVTRDRALAARVREAFAMSHTAAWLLQRLDGGAARSTRIGRGRPQRPSAQAHGERAGVGSADSDDAPDREPWQPGRGATRKRGNPRRAPRAAPQR